MQTQFRVVAYPAGWRWLAAGLFLLSRFSLVAIALMFLLGWFISPPLLVRLILFLALVPGLLLILLRVVFAAECEISPGTLSIRARGWYRRKPIEVSLADGHLASPWSLPLPGPGMSIRLAQASGSRHLPLETNDSAAILSAVTLGSSASVSKMAQASLAYSEVQATSRLARWHWPLFKFGLFGLLPVFVIFRLHQSIMYGGLFGQYHLHGLGPWLSSLAYHWIMVTIYLLLYAAFWRSGVEAICWLSARYAPARAGLVRAAGELLALAVYFAGIPAFIVWRSFF